MIIVIKNDPDKKQMDNLVKWIKGLGLDIHMSRGDNSTVMGLIGDTSVVDEDLIRSLDIVESVKRIQEPFKNANRKFHPEDTIVDVGGHLFGGGHFQLIAGPCSVESEDQIVAVAKAVKAAGATVLRGGAFKPRTSPYAFQGLRAEGMKLLSLAKKETGMPVCTEILDIRHLPLFEDVDLIQVGARNMQNFELLKELGKVGAGADGLEIEVHNDPLHALSDGAQSLRPEQFDDLVRRIDVLLTVCGKERDK